VNRRTLERSDLEDLLSAFEDAWAEQTGERLTTAEFYDRYRRGEAPDTTFSMSWASYYEIASAASQQTWTWFVRSLRLGDLREADRA
jgi:hypothetical protein